MPAMAVGQLTFQVLTHRHRWQASSYIDPVSAREFRVDQKSSLTITVHVIPAANSTPSGTSSI